jgi:hypothetical protein
MRRDYGCARPETPSPWLLHVRALLTKASAKVLFHRDASELIDGVLA